MAAVLLVTLYEYSPLFYIFVVSLCFLVTAAAVLGWFGFDVPVIMHRSDEEESVVPIPEKHMVQVLNPFGLQLGSGPASVTDGVSVKAFCLEPCILTCFWGCGVSALQGALEAQHYGPRLSTPHQHFQEALQSHCQYFQTFLISSDDWEERRSQISAAQGITDFGLLPREQYPLVAILTLAEPDLAHKYNIVASVTVIHVPDNRHRLCARILFQHLVTSQGNVYELKPLFMATDRGEVPGPPDSDHNDQHNPVLEDWGEAKARDCVVCQNAAVNRVLLPCRHACVCDSCLSHFQHCPICRAFILESFALLNSAAST
ncbi:cell growth regulator with RING finger domain protein 1 isoform X2 [Thalassophryne amazonica]|uniref:cell growth regulator with RING finger domain protein 1 isoform X2 n=1 Tax=Thalassophryne amazonica TaxID=390379 RepID=UPI0014717A25|nr:cell growth regulator with RING finger domain protein 1 isoform X2 [Thalassophryne amazonica]